VNPAPSWRRSAPPPAVPPEPGPGGCLAAWVRLLKKQHRPEDSIPLRVGVGVSVMVALVGALHQMDWPVYGWIILPMTVAGFVFSWKRRRQSNWWVKAILSLLMPVVLVNFFLGLMATPYDPRLPLAELLLWLQTLHSFDVPARKDLKYSLLVGIILISFGAVLSSSLSYVLYLTAFLTGALGAMHLGYLSQAREECDRVLQQGPRPGLLPAILGQATRTALTMVLAGALVFALMPRYESLRLQSLPVSWNMRLALPRIGRGEVINPSYPAGMSPDSDRTRFSSDNYAGFNHLVDLSLRGSLSDEVVMRVRSSRWSYYRGLAFTGYDGRFWSLPEGEPQRISSATPPLTVPLRRRPRRAENLVQIFHVERELPNVVFAPFQPHQVYFPSEELFIDQALGMRAPFPLEEGMVYSVIGVQAPFSPERLKRLPTLEAFPNLARSANTRLPEGISPRVRNLAARLTRNRPSPYEKALALTLHLQENYRYESPPPPYPTGAEVADHFLFESRRGHCEQYATAMVVMARTIGLPARYVTGYLPGNYNPFTGFYEVRGSQAHAWVEVFLPGLDWLAFDPTPSGNGAATPQLQDRQGQRWMLGDLLVYLKNLVPEARRAAAVRLWARTREGLAGRLTSVAIPVATVLLALAVGAGSWMLRRARKAGRWNPLTRSLDRVARTLTALLPESPRTPRGRILHAYHDMEAALARRGLPRQEQRTPREYARTVLQTLGWPEIQTLTECFEVARYSREDALDAQERRATEALEDLRRRLREKPSATGVPPADTPGR